MRAWLSAHRPLAASVLGGAVVTALVATLAIVSPGYSATRMDLRDPAVWVASTAQQAVGRVNTEVFELDSVVPVDGDAPQLVQSGSTVLLVDAGSATVRPIDPATAQLGDEVALPPRGPRVLLAGERAVVVAQTTGEVWVLPLADLAAFDASAPPTLSLGAGAVVTASEGGALLAYLPDTRQVWRMGPTDAAVSERWDVAWGDAAADTDSVQIAAVGERWAVLDTTTRELATEEAVRDLAGVLAGTGVRLQESGPTGDTVLVADSRGLAEVPLAGGAPTVLVGDASGVPAAPVVVAGCRFAAWSTGTAWRGCAGADPTRLRLAGMPGGPALRLAVNGARVVLTDAVSGSSWAVQAEGELVDNWDELISDEQQQEETPEASEDSPPELEETPQPPTAVDDAFGARPGRATVLPVLLNDFDPNGDVLVVTAFDQIDERLGRLDLVARNQQLQLTLADTASGVIRFGYTIDDGHGGSSSAVVTVDVRTPAENSPPRQVRVSTATVASGGRVTTQVIGNWVDPDGDSVHLVEASVAEPDRVAYKPDGVVVFTDAGASTGLTTVALTVSDGRSETAGSLQVTVRPRGEVPIVVERWVALATAGDEITVRPLQHVRGGNGPIRLGGVPPKAGATIVASFEAGTFTFVSDRVGTHDVEFTVTDGTQTVTGTVRIDVAAPADASTRPITVPQTMFITSRTSQLVDPPTTDIDPAGGVLVVTGVMNVPPGSGVQAEVLDQRRIRVTLTAPLAEDVVFNYRISNGLAEAVGTITVVEIPRPARLQPPIATDDTATVRVGEVVDIPVLDNDEQPDGDDIALLPELAEPLPEDAGLLFVSGDRLRYLAPETAGNYTAIYSIAGADGQLAQARVTISVRERDAATNNPPVPRTVTARVLAGRTVRIDVPLDGIDPDGDAVQLVGQATNPEKGSVLRLDDGTIEYRAGDYSSGTDVFQYVVADGLGARTTGTIRVGISPALEGARTPVANADTVLVRPGRSVSVRALLNDSDPDGSPLTIRQVEPNSAEVAAEIVGDDVVRITPPPVAGDYGVIYTIENQTGGTSSNFIRVTVDPDAPLARPSADDTVLSVTDVLDRTSVDVAVLDRVFFADGEVSELGVELVPEFGTSATVLPDKRVRVQIGDRSQIIPFAVVHPDNPQVRAYAFIRVPGYDDALPQINTQAPPLVVKSESPLRIELAQYVVALGGSAVRVTDSSTVRATHADGSSLVVDQDTLQYVSADRYWGPASITFEVTDGASASDPDAHVTTLSLPITVEPRDNQPPIFTGGVIEFEPGQQKELDLVKLTKYPYDDDIDELAYTVLAPTPEGFSFEVNGQRLLLMASPAAVKGTATSITLAVRDALNEGQAGRVQLRVVPSTRPLATPAPDRAIARRGETTVLDVLANDSATNPFPEVPLRVVDIRGLDGAEVPDGITISPSADRSRLAVTVAETAEPVDVTLQYQLADATGDPERMTWGLVTISVQDVPDAPTGVRVVEFGDRVLRLGWSAGAANNAPITEYRVTLGDAAGTVLSTTSCANTVGCPVTTPGNGPEHAVRISVVAVNAIGASDPATSAGTIWSDVVPPAPSSVTATPVDHGLRVVWHKPATTSGSPVDSYLVTVGGRQVTVPAASEDPVGTEYARIVTDSALANGSAVNYTVSARNRAPNSLATWNEAGGSATPAGAPILVASPTASASTSDGTTVGIGWAGAFSANGKTISRYYVARHAGTPPACVVTGVETGAPVLSPPTGGDVQELAAGTTGATFTGLAPDVDYFFTVYAYNGQGCTASATVTATPRARPGTVVGATISAPVARDGGHWDFQLTDVETSGGSVPDSVVYRLSGGSTDTTQSALTPLDAPAYLVSGTTHYGNDVSVELKACRQYPEVLLCSADWSAPVHLGRPVSIQLSGLLAVESLAPADGAPGQGAWSWTAAPQPAVDGGRGYDAVTIGCGPDDVAETPLQCEVVGTGPDGDAYPQLTVTVTADGVNYARTYTWADALHPAP